MEFFGKEVLGKQYYTVTDKISDLLGHFAEGLRNKLCIVFNEASGKDTFMNDIKIETRISDEALRYEKKFCDQTTITNSSG